MNCTHEHDKRSKGCAPCYVRRRTQPLSRRFWAKVNRRGPLPAHNRRIGRCWIWTTSTDVNGYGQMSVGLPNGRRTMAKAHRIGYELRHGTQPRGGAFRHLCDNAICVRASHLRYGTQGDNVRDMFAKGRNNPRRTPPARRLTWTDAVEIRRRRAAGETQMAIAATYGATRGQIGNVDRDTTFARAAR